MSKYIHAEYWNRRGRYSCLHIPFQKRLAGKRISAHFFMLSLLYHTQINQSQSKQYTGISPFDKYSQHNHTRHKCSKADFMLGTIITRLQTCYTLKQTFHAQMQLPYLVITSRFSLFYQEA